MGFIEGEPNEGGVGDWKDEKPTEVFEWCAEDGFEHGLEFDLDEASEENESNSGDDGFWEGTFLELDAVGEIGEEENGQERDDVEVGDAEKVEELRALEAVHFEVGPETVLVDTGDDGPGTEENEGVVGFIDCLFDHGL